MLGHPVAENPIDRMFDGVYAHYGLHWQFWKCDVAAVDLPAAIAGTRALGFRGYGITVPYKIDSIPYLDGIDDDAPRDRRRQLRDRWRTAASSATTTTGRAWSRRLRR